MSGIFCTACSPTVAPVVAEEVLGVGPSKYSPPRIPGKPTDKKTSIRIDENCSDFPSQAKAQAFFIEEGGPARDPHKLDADKDGLACEE